MRILWTKIYNVNHKLGLIRIYISHHSNGAFFGGVHHYTKTGNWSNEDSISLDFKLEQFLEMSEEKAYQACLNWINSNYKGDFNVQLDEYKEFDK
ncbi:MAG: hypothetical protein PHC31_09915 [Clostridia bacterium]|nr:hypothetical protein [Clostridia bacterium]